MEEVNWSRVLGGVHFRHAVVEGAKLGDQVAQAAMRQFEGERSEGLPAWETGWAEVGGCVVIVCCACSGIASACMRHH